jgi:hypothetical protein
MRFDGFCRARDLGRPFYCAQSECKLGRIHVERAFLFLRARVRIARGELGRREHRKGLWGAGCPICVSLRGVCVRFVDDFRLGTFWTYISLFLFVLSRLK